MLYNVIGDNMKLIDNGKKVIITITDEDKVTLVDNNNQTKDTNITKIIIEKTKK